MKQSIAIAVAAVLIVGAGWREWTWTGFPSGISETAEEQEFAKRLEKVPLDIGEWEGTDLEKMGPRERATAGISGELSRSYHNRRTGDTVSMFIVSGNHRQIAQHTPNQCYVAAGYTMMSEPSPYSVEVGPETVDFSTTEFKKEQASGTQLLRIFWTWSSNGKWESPTWGRVNLAGRPALYKMYLSTDEFHSGGRSIERTPSLMLIRDILPVLNAALFPPSDGSTSDEPAK
jgi:Protein of unknown function (DUF3485)